MTTSESKPTQTPTGEIVLQSLSWDHTNRTAEAKIENALRFWCSLHGRDVMPNTCFVPASEKAKWEGTHVEGIDVKLTTVVPNGQILLALVITPESGEEAS